MLLVQKILKALMPSKHNNLGVYMINDIFIESKTFRSSPTTNRLSYYLLQDIRYDSHIPISNKSANEVIPFLLTIVGLVIL